MIMIAPAALPAAAPVLLLWFVAPEVAIWVSRILPQRPETISEADRKFLRLVARRTWLFFETFVRPEDNWLPPDNYQEPPNEETAHRTSPTNIGMMLIRSEEHTSELQSLMRISYAVFCLKKKKTTNNNR